MIFVLSPGSDPLQSLQKYADDVKRNLIAISLGQGMYYLYIQAKNLMLEESY